MDIVRLAAAELSETALKSTVKAETRSRLVAWFGGPLSSFAAVILVVAIVAGGGGAEGPLNNGIIEAFSAVLLVACAASHFTNSPMPSNSAVPLWCAVATLLVTALQLLPLPPGLWTNLPGRELARAAAGLTGEAGSWKPLSLDPEATRRTAAALLPPIAIMLATIRCGEGGIRLLLRALIAAAALGSALAGIQIAAGTPDGLMPYGDPTAGVGTGFFANRNHQATLMLGALIASGLLVRLRTEASSSRTRGWIDRISLAWLFFPIFIVGTIATQSRAGLLLLPPTLLGAVIIASDNKISRSIAVVTGAGIGFAVALVLLTNTGMWAKIPGGSDLLADARATNFPDIVYTTRQYWPFGSGFGTFVPVFMANENLDVAQAAYLNHAHNDYLELLIEGGLAAACLLTMWSAAIALRIRRLLVRSGEPQRSYGLCGLVILLVIAGHSLVDYPLRTDAIAVVAGLAVGLLFRPTGAARFRRTTPRLSPGFENFGFQAVRRRD